MEKFTSSLKFLSIAGVGLFGDGFLNISIGLVVPVIGLLYYQDDTGKVPTVQNDVVKGGLSLGMIIGQLLFGIFGDALGRHKIYGKELIITIFGTLMLIVPPTYLGHDGIVAWLTTFRIITGLGIGGDYPVTSAISAENNLLGSRAKLVLSVFSCLGLGVFSSGITFLVLLAAFKGAISNDINKLQWVWRLLFAIGLLPLILTLYARLTMKESKPYEEYVSTETSLVGKQKRGLREQFRDFKEYFAIPKHGRTLFAVSAAWFLFDIAYYGINYNQSIVLKEIGYGTGDTAFDTLWNTAIGNIIVVLAGYLPGFYLGIFLPDIMGRIRQQFVFSALAAVLYGIWAGVTDITSTGGLLAMFTISQFVLNVGPNCTTFLLPAEVFPTRVRATAHGIAAASGKAGAVITAFTFGSVREHIGLNGVLGIFSGIMALTALVTFWIPETKDISLAQIEAGYLYDEAERSTLQREKSHESRSDETEISTINMDKSLKDGGS